MPDVTAADLIDETQGLLQTFAQDSDQVTTLGADCAPTDLTVTVSTVRSGTLGLSPGVIEIGSELMFVTAIDQNSGVATVAPWGRGYLGTTATSHSNGDRVTSQPTFPRHWVLNALNETINRVFPEIFVPKVATLTTTVPKITYDLPDDADWVLDARWQPPTGTSYWQGVKRWRDSRGGTTVSGDPGVAVDVADVMTPGCPIEFTYAAAPVAFTDETSTYASTGLPDGVRDVLVLGAASALTTSQELSRLQTSSVEQQDRAHLVAPAAALTSSRFLEQKFQLRLSEEVKSLRRKWPLRPQWSWV